MLLPNSIQFRFEINIKKEGNVNYEEEWIFKKIYRNVSRICNAHGGFVNDNVREFIHRWLSEAAECG